MPSDADRLDVEGAILVAMLLPSSWSSDPGAHVLSPASGTRLRRSVPEAELAADRAGVVVEPEADGTGTQMIEADGAGACFVGVGCAAD